MNWPPLLLEVPSLVTVWHFPGVPAVSEGAFLRFRRLALCELGFAGLAGALLEGLRLPFGGTAFVFGFPPNWLAETSGPAASLSLFL